MGNSETKKNIGAADRESITANPFVALLGNRRAHDPVG